MSWPRPVPLAGQRGREAAHGAVLGHSGLEPLLDLRIRAGEGAGACLATGLLRCALAIRRGAARTADQRSRILNS